MRRYRTEKRLIVRWAVIFTAMTAALLVSAGILVLTTRVYLDYKFSQPPPVRARAGLPAPR